ncbi:MAG: hypothetical protein ABJA66_03985 [Actinomycetota bacterium]
MKQLPFKVLIAFGTLVISITATVWFTDYFTRSGPDSNVYSVDFCELAENPRSFNGKFVRIKGGYGGLGTDTPTFLTSSRCNQRIYDTCKMDTNNCVRMYSQLRSIFAGIDPRISAKIEVVGRFWVNVDNPLKTDRLYRESVNLVEVTELIGIEAVKSPSTP